MPREGAIIFRDLVGKLDNIECKCGRLLEGTYRAQLFSAKQGLAQHKPSATGSSRVLHQIAVIVTSSHVRRV
jgi:hypothetical protein